MKTKLKWIVIALLCPVLLFLVLAALIYLPPVQQWAVRHVSAIASEKTGMDISVGHVNLEWPLNLGMDSLMVVHQGDTIADIGHLVADVRLRPLFGRRIVVSALVFSQTRLNTNGFISDVQVRGSLEELSVRSRGIDLDRETIELNGARLSGARLHIALSDTAAADTTTSHVTWRINADSLSIYDTSVSLSLPGDSTAMTAYLGHTVARQAHIDLDSGTYQVGSFGWHDGSYTLCATKPTHANKPPRPTSHPTHSTLATDTLLAISAIDLAMDSIYYGPEGTRLCIRQAAMRERSGLQLTHLSTAVRLDTAFTHIDLPHLRLLTTDSEIEAQVAADFSVADSVAPGKMEARLMSHIGKQDLARLLTLLKPGDMDLEKLIRQYPNHPLSLRGDISGNLERMELRDVQASLPTAFKATVSGFVAHARDPQRLRSQLAVGLETQNLDFVAALLPPEVGANYRVPAGTRLKASLTADGPQYGADISGTMARGTLKAKGSYNTTTTAYQAHVDANGIDLHAIMPRDSLFTLTARAQLSGKGTNLLSTATHGQAQLSIRHLGYGQFNLDSISATAQIANGEATVSLTSHNDLLQGSVGFSGTLDKHHVDGVVSTSVAMADLQRMQLSEKPLAIGLGGDIKVKSNLHLSHELSGLISNIYIRDRRNTYHPENVGVLLRTNNDTTLLRLQAGTFITKVDASGNYRSLARQLTTLTDTVMEKYRENIIDQVAVKRLLPTGRLYLTSGHSNPLADILRTKGIEFSELLVDINTSPITGINGEARLWRLIADSTQIDTVRLTLTQKGDRLAYNGVVANNRHNPQFVFTTLFDGHLHHHGALMGIRYYDDKQRMGVRVGATAQMETGGLRLQLMPKRPTIGYKEFNLNSDNYIFLGSDKHIEAKIDLVADDGTGMKLYTEDTMHNTPLDASDDGNEQAHNHGPLDLTVSLNRFNLDEFTSVLPYMPRMTGLLGGDFHIVQDEQKHFSVVSDMAVSQMTYEGAPIGNLSAEINYLQREDGGHAMETRLMVDDDEVGLLSGTYNQQSSLIDATLKLTRTPLRLVNGFVPDQLIGLDGYADGELSVKGTPTKPVVNGELYLDSAYLVSQPYGVSLRFDNDPVRVEDSRLYIENFGLYATGKEPLVIMGNIDFTNLQNITTDLRMRATNFQIINSKQTARSVAFGKAFVDLYARMQGPLDQLMLRGRLNLLASTDMTYMLLDSPLSTDNRLSELVQFTDFADTTRTVVTRPRPSGLKADLTISVAQGARIVCNLNAEQTNYVDLTGGGDLKMGYGIDGVTLSGRYTVAQGEMKYSLPVIPLKTFTISPESYVEFTGDPTNPKLNITATERTKATVAGSGQDGATRAVTFDCGVVITKTLADMGLQFIIDAPEDTQLSSELKSMGAEERGKLAVTMLTTGMYLADGNTSAFSMNAALSSFLQSEINQIAGSALKTLDLQVGVDNSTSATGEMRTDYSFRFAKRFLNNRLKIQLGGKVSSGSEMPGQQQSFFDNVTMEYRLDQSGRQNVKLFFQQNVYDWLEGYTGLYGAGFVWRRKVSTLKDVLLFWRKQPTDLPPAQRNAPQQPARVPGNTVAGEQPKKDPASTTP